MSILFAIHKKHKERFELFKNFLEEKNLVSTIKYIEDYTLKNFIEFNLKNQSGITHMLIDIESISDNSLSFSKTVNALEKLGEIKVGLFIEDIMNYQNMFRELGKNGFFNVIVGSPSELFLLLREKFFSQSQMDKFHYEKIENYIQEETDKNKNYLFLRNNTEISLFCIKHQSDFLSFLNACRLVSYFSFLKASSAFLDKGNENRFRLLSEIYPSFQYHPETNSYSYQSGEYYQKKENITPKNYLLVNHGYLSKSRVPELKKSSILVMCCQCDFIELQEAVTFIDEQLFDYKKLFILIENAPFLLRSNILNLFQFKSKMALKVEVFFTEPSPHFFEVSNKEVYKNILKNSMLEI